METPDWPLTLRMFSAARTVLRSGHSLRASSPPAFSQAKTRRRTRRPWPSIYGVEEKPRPRSTLQGSGSKTRVFEVCLGRVVGPRLIRLLRRQIISLPIPDALGNILRAHRVKRNQGSFQRETTENIGDRRNLIRIITSRSLRTRRLPEYQ